MYKGFTSGSAIKNLPAKQRPQESLVHFLVGKDPLEADMAIHSSILSWRILWKEPGGLQSISRKELDTTEVTENTHMCIDTHF